MAAGTKTRTQKRTTLESVQADLDHAQSELERAEEEHATVSTAIGNGEPVDMDQFSSVEQRRIFWRKRANGLAKRAQREELQASIARAEAYLSEHKTRARELANAALVKYRDAVGALNALFEAASAFNRNNADAKATVTDLHLRGQETPRELRTVLGQINIAAEDLAVFQLAAAAIAQSVRDLRLGDTDSQALRSLEQTPRPKPSVVLNHLRGVARAGRE